MSTSSFRDEIRSICATDRVTDDIPRPEERTPAPEEISRTRSQISSRTQAKRREMTKLLAPPKKARGRAHKTKDVQP